MLGVIIVGIRFLLIFIFPIVLCTIALYFKSKSTFEIGKSGFITQKSIKSKETWNYAQKIAPNVYLKMSIVCAFLDFLITIVMFVANIEYETIICFCSFVGLVFAIIPFFIVDKKIDEFSDIISNATDSSKISSDSRSSL